MNKLQVNKQTSNKQPTVHTEELNHKSDTGTVVGRLYQYNDTIDTFFIDKMWKNL